MSGLRLHRASSGRVFLATAAGRKRETSAAEAAIAFLEATRHE